MAKCMRPKPTLNFPYLFQTHSSCSFPHLFSFLNPKIHPIFSLLQYSQSKSKFCWLFLCVISRLCHISDLHCYSLTHSYCSSLLTGHLASALCPRMFHIHQSSLDDPVEGWIIPFSSRFFSGFLSHAKVKSKVLMMAHRAPYYLPSTW